MADVVERGNLFDPVIVNDLITKVKGESALAVLCGSTPIPFNGQKEYVFSMDDEVDLVAESGRKSRGHIGLATRTIAPLKVEYGARLSDEFLFASEEARLDVFAAFNDGFAKKVARGIDIMAMHGVNPRSGTASTLIGTNHFDASDVPTVTPTGSDTANDCVEKAIELIMAANYDVDGIAISPAFRSELSKLTYKDGKPFFPELTWGKMAGSLNGLTAACNNTLVFGDATDNAIVGDFARGFRWGYSKQIPFEVIRYGDPDNSGQDLKGYNQIYIRAEVYLGWAILDKNAFAVIKAGE